MRALIAHWSDLIWDLSSRASEATCTEGIQRIFASYKWEIPAKDLIDAPITLGESGYKQQKLTQLSRYYTPQNLERALSDLEARLKKRKHGSGVIYFQGEKKKNTKQDWCMTAMVVSYYPRTKETKIVLYYRSAEAIKRFRGDLVYLTDVVLPKFKHIFKEAPPTTITFNFANITLHPMFWVLMIAHMPAWEVNLAILRKEQPELFRDIAYWCWGYLLDPRKALDKYSSARQVRVIAERCTKPERLKKFKLWLSSIIKKDAKHYPEKIQQWSKKR